MRRTPSCLPATASSGAASGASSTSCPCTRVSRTSGSAPSSSPSSRRCLRCSCPSRRCPTAPASSASTSGSSRRSSSTSPPGSRGRCPPTSGLASAGTPAPWTMTWTPRTRRTFPRRTCCPHRHPGGGPPEGHARTCSTRVYTPQTPSRATRRASQAVYLTLFDTVESTGARCTGRSARWRLALQRPGLRP